MLNIAVCQTDLHWENPEKNRAHLESLALGVKLGTDIILFPEMCTTGFSMNTNVLAEEMEGRTVQWLRLLAKLKQCVIAGSFIIKEKDVYVNRFIWMHPNGEMEYYDKHHLFRLANEHLSYSAGMTRKIVTFKDWRINLNVCYDLRFPVWSRNQDDYDVLINVANWPVQRSTAWKTLLRARAIENQCYMIGCNRVGEDEKGNVYSGDSSIIQYDGEILETNEGEETILYASLDKSGLNAFRKKLPFSQDKDTFVLK